MSNSEFGFNPTNSGKVRFYFNFKTGAIKHTNDSHFIVDENYRYIDIFYPDTALSATIIEDEMKWVIHRWGKVIKHYKMNEAEIDAYKAEIVRKVTQTLTK